MFVARDKELAALSRMYEKPGFQMAVVYGRRRVGKTSLIDEFVRDKHALYFTAQQKSAHQNLELFSEAIYSAFGLPELPGCFPSWKDAFSFIAGRVKSAAAAPLIFVFDEFPYAAETEPSLPSALQIAIDHEFKQLNLKVILCGSNEGFMESEVLGSKSPLFGRRTLQIRVKPFGYLDAAKMLPGAEPLDLVQYYATFGGTPYYLSQLDESLSYADNVRELMFDPLGFLFEEPLMLLRQEVREPALYNSVLDAIGAGNTAPQRIAEHSGVNPNSVAKYLKSLVALGIIERNAPFGENAETSRKAIYRIKDPFFAYWYRFVSRYTGAIEEGAGAVAAAYATGGEALPTYIGKQYESICLQWIQRKNAAGELPFSVFEFGQWWGTDPKTRERADIDVIAANRNEKRVFAGECKWRNHFDWAEAARVLEHRAQLLKGFNEQSLYLFSKNRLNESAVDELRAKGVKTVCAEDLYV